MMIQRLGGIVFCLTISLACSAGGGGAQQGTTGQEAGAPPAAGTAAQSPNAGAQPAGTAPGPQAVPTASGAQPAASAANAAPAQQPVGTPSAAPAAPSQPQFREVTIPAGTTLNLALETSVSSDQSKAEDRVRAKLSKPIVIGGSTVMPEGAIVTGSVLEAKQSGRVKGRATVSLRFDRLQAGNEAHSIRTARITREAQATKGEDAKKIGIGAGAGAAIGAIAGGKKGAAVGGAVGAGAGTGVVVATRGEEVRLAPGTTLRTRLEEPVKILVPVKP